MHSTTLHDPFQRRLSYLRLSVTDLCNFKCHYCLPNGYQGKRPRNELTLTEIEHLVRHFAKMGTKKVRLTGGEPSLRKDITDIIQACHSTKGIEKIAMTTNGWKLEKHYHQWINAGLNQLNISVDSFDRQEFKKITGHDSLPILLKTIDEIIVDNRLNLKINAMLFKENHQQLLEQALNYIQSRPVAFRFIELMQTHENYDLFKRSHLSATTIGCFLERAGWQQKPRKTHSGPAIEYEHPNYQGRIGLIAPYSKDFCKTCNRLRITSQGKLHLCLFDRLSFDIRPYLSEESAEQLQQYMKHLMTQKPESHYLKNEEVGLIQNLAMIGG